MIFETNDCFIGDDSVLLLLVPDIVCDFLGVRTIFF